MFILLILTLNLFLINCLFTDAAGIAVHLSIASRLNEYLPDSIRSTYNTYLAGAFHPDAFYNCLGSSEAAEDAHWPPFMKIAVEYYNQRYAANNIKNTDLKVFLYGIFTHQITDVAWHSLQSNQGLMEMISKVEFNGDFQTAHNFLDTAGDFILLNRQFQNLSKDKKDELLKFYRLDWEYPIDDILNIYHIMGHLGISMPGLQFCMQRGYAGLQTEIAAVLTARSGGHRFNIDLQKSPLTVQLLDDYFYGGIDEIVNTVKTCFKNLDDWFNGNISENPWDICPTIFKEHDIKAGTFKNIVSKSISYNKINIYSSYKIQCDDKLYLSPLISNSQFGTSIKVGNYLGESSLAVGSPFDEGLGSVYLIPLSEIIPSPKYQIKVHKSKKLTPSYVSSLPGVPPLTFPPRFGLEMSTWKLSAYEFLVISEPGLSNFKIFFHGSLIAVINHGDVTTKLGSKGLKQLNLLTKEEYDVNNDGWQDLIVGSCFADDGKAFQLGKVFTLSGRLFFNLIENMVVNSNLINSVPIDLKMETISLGEYIIPREIILKNHYEQFGCSIAFSTDYALIGVNSLGSVLLFNRHTCEYQGRISPLSSTFESRFFNYQDNDRYSSKDTQLFGFNFILTGSYKGVEWVMVSNSADSLSDSCPLCGSVLLYVMQNNDPYFLVKLVPVKPSGKISDSKFLNGMFGISALKITESKVVVSSNGYNDGRGAIYLISLGSIIDDYLYGRKLSSSIAADILIEGDSDFGYTNFGHSMEYFEFRGDSYLALGLPKFGYSNQFEDSSKLVGYIQLKKI